MTETQLREPLDQLGRTQLGRLGFLASTAARCGVGSPTRSASRKMPRLFLPLIDADKITFADVTRAACEEEKGGS
jgi:hypothetical protein